MYLESIHMESQDIKRRGVLSTIEITNEALDAENVEIEFDYENSKIIVVPTEGNEKHVCLLDKVGIYRGYSAIVDILFVDEEKMILMPVDGFVCLATIDENGEDVLSCLDVSDAMPNVIRQSDIIWKSAKDIMDTIRSARGSQAWGSRSHINTYDYVYRIKFTNNSTDKSIGYNLKCIETLDISNGLIQKELAKDEVKKYKYEKLKYARDVAQTEKTQVYYDKEPIVDSDDEEEYLDLFED